MTHENAALEGIFPMVEQVLSRSNLRLNDVECFIYCEGPGSVLGLRLAAMALQTWEKLSNKAPLFHAYNGLQLTAQLMLKDSIEQDALLISDWKKNAWNAVRIADGQVHENEVVDDATLANRKGSIYHLPQRKGWQTPPPQARTLEYQPHRIIELEGLNALLHTTELVELSQTAANTFAKWTPQRHRAPDSKLVT